MRRMDKYQNDEATRTRRTDKNKKLYENINTNVIYANLSDVENANAFEIDNTSNPTDSYHTREAYHKMQKYRPEEIPRSKRELNDLNRFQNRPNKVYDINSVLEQARKNRTEIDSREQKRKLTNTSYNILSGLNKEELEKYREEKKKRILTPEEEELRELIDTIASKTLAGEIDKATSVDLLSDLMATNMLDKVDPSNIMGEETHEEETTPQESQKEINKVEEKEEQPKINEAEEKKEKEQTEEKEQTKELSNSKQILDTEELKIIEERKQEEVTEEELKGKDPEFYTRSMDLSDKDFEMSNDFKEKSMPVFLKIIIALLIIAVIAAAGYYIYLRIK